MYRMYGRISAATESMEDAVMSPIIARGLPVSPTALLPGPLMLVPPFRAVLYRLAMPGPADPVPKSPSPRLWRMRSLQLAGSAVAGALAAATGAGLAAGAPAGAAAVAAVAVAAGLAAWFVRRRVRAWSYTERDEDLIVSRGVLVRRLSVVPYGRMQFVDVTAGPVERAFRLATVKLHTAAAASDARIPGLERDEAARLRDRLAALGEAKAAGL